MLQGSSHLKPLEVFLNSGFENWENMKVSSSIIILIAFKFVPVGRYEVENKRSLENQKLTGLLIIPFSVRA